jgi:hypothetical protein
MRSFANCKSKGKGKDHLHDCFCRQEGRQSITPTHSQPRRWSVGGVVVERHVAAALPFGEYTVPIVQEAWLVGLGAALDGAEILPSAGIRSPDRPARGKLLYRLRYPGHFTNCPYPVLLGP